MRPTIAGAAALLVGTAFVAGTGLAAEPQELAFTAEGERYAVPEGGLTSIETPPEGGLTFCPDAATEGDLAAFTARHVGDTVAVSIGDSDLFHLQIAEPYQEGCITWPLHPMVARTYYERLTGEPAPAAAPAADAGTAPQDAGTDAGAGTNTGAD